MNKKGFLKKLSSAVILGASITPLIANAGELSGEIASTIILTEDTVLTGDVKLVNNAKLLINNDTITIDLNGYQLEQTKNAYAIDNASGSLTLKDSVGTGKVLCVSTSSSCIRNYKELTIEKVHVKSMYSSLKNEEGTTSTIRNSVLEANGNGGAIQNFGELYLENTTLRNESDLYSTAILGGSYANYDASVYAKNCTFDAMEVVQTIRHPASPSGTSCENLVTVDGGTLLKEGMIRLDDPNSNAVAKGNITSSINMLAYALPGTNITLNKNVDMESLSIPANVSLTVPESISFKVKTLDKAGNLILADNKVLETDEQGNVEVLTKADYQALNETLEKIENLNKELYTKESLDQITAIMSKIETNKSEREQNIVEEWNNELTEALNNIEYKKADYTELEKVLAKIEEIKEELYTEESLEVLKKKKDEISKDLNILEQNKVAEWVTSLEKLLENLEYKKADYTELNQILETIKSLDKSLYKEESLQKIESIVNEIDLEKDITEQNKVYAWVNLLKENMDNLEKKEEQKPDVTVSENPKTLVSTLTTIILAVVSIICATLSLKKIIKKA